MGKGISNVGPEGEKRSKSSRIRTRMNFAMGDGTISRNQEKKKKIRTQKEIGDKGNKKKKRSKFCRRNRGEKTTGPLRDLKA